MKNKLISYAASFGNSIFTKEDYPALNKRLNNFNALGIRENLMIPYIKNVCILVQRVIDLTSLLINKDYEKDNV